MLLLTAFRTRTMFLIAGIPHLSTLITPPLSGLLMQYGIWVPFTVSIAAYTLGLLVLALMPECFRQDAAAKSPLLAPSDRLHGTEEISRDPSSDEQLPRGIHGQIHKPDARTRAWWRDIVSLLQMPGIPFCYTLFFFKPVAMISKAFMYQYASYNFRWELRRTTWLRFSQAGGSTIATIVILPILHSVLRRRGPEAKRLDLNVIRLSLLISTVGFALLQFSSHGWILLLGNTSKMQALSPKLTSYSTLHMWLERGRRTSTARLDDHTYRSYLPRKVIHLPSCRGNCSKVGRRAHDGQTLRH